MKLSPQTIAVLSNFSGINSNLVFREGSEIRTLSPTMEIYAKATIPEEFPTNFQIYDLNEFLGVMNMFTEPDITFLENYLSIRSESTSVKYHYGDLDVFMPKKDVYKLKVPSYNPDVSFTLKQTDLQNLHKACRLLRTDKILFESKTEDKLLAKVEDPSNPLSNSYAIEMDCVIQTEGSSFKFVYDASHLKLIAGDYNVSFSGSGKAPVSLFVLDGVEGYGVEYFIAPNTASKFSLGQTQEEQEDPPF